jgi:hypothetical protein
MITAKAARGFFQTKPLAKGFAPDIPPKNGGIWGARSQNSSTTELKSTEPSTFLVTKANANKVLVASQTTVLRPNAGHGLPARELLLHRAGTKLMARKKNLIFLVNFAWAADVTDP